VGFNLYTQLLAQAVEEQKATLNGVKQETSAIHRPEPSVDLPLRAFIPDSYIPDMENRLGIYSRLAVFSAPEQTEDLAKELIDRQVPCRRGAKFALCGKAQGFRRAAGIESITSNNSIVTIRLFPYSSTSRNSSFLRYGIKVGITQLIINLKNLGLTGKSSRRDNQVHSVAQTWKLKILEVLIKRTYSIYCTIYGSVQSVMVWRFLSSSLTSAARDLLHFRHCESLP
jgi:transcription-repair coupling factor (superfamily II helicase)